MRASVDNNLSEWYNEDKTLVFYMVLSAVNDYMR